VAQHTIIVESASQPAAKQKRRKAPLILAGIGLVALVPVVGSTFAANIAINSNSAIEFGQGNQAVAACDDNIVVTPEATFDPAGSGSWSLTINLSEISAACDGKSFDVTAWDADSALEVQSFDYSESTMSGTNTLTFGTATPEDLLAITIETSDI
jgi:hypothetical protein